MQSQLAAGEIRVIGAASLRRSALTPNLPTLAEQGLPGFEIMNVIGIMAPAGTPQPIVARLNSEIARIVNTPESKSFLNTRGNDTADDTSAEAYAAYIRKDTEKFKQIIEATGFKKQ